MNYDFFHRLVNLIEPCYNDCMTTLTEQLDPVKLRAARLKAGITGEEMGRLLNVGKTQISNIEAGRSVLDSNALRIWCKACKVKNPFDLFSPVPDDPLSLAK